MIDTQVKHEQQNYVFIEILYNYWGSLYLRPPDSLFFTILCGILCGSVQKKKKNALCGVVIAQVNLDNTTFWQ